MNNNRVPLTFWTLKCNIVVMDDRSNTVVRPKKCVKINPVTHKNIYAKFYPDREVKELGKGLKSGGIADIPKEKVIGAPMKETVELGRGKATTEARKGSQPFFKRLSQDNRINMNIHKEVYDMISSLEPSSQVSRSLPDLELCSQVTIQSDCSSPNPVSPVSSQGSEVTRVSILSERKSENDGYCNYINPSKRFKRGDIVSEE